MGLDEDGGALGDAILPAAGGDDAVAENLYIACARTDATYVPMAAFGLARIRAATGQVADFSKIAG